MPKVLVVDDSQIVLEGVKDLLEGDGFEVETVQSVFRVGQIVARFQPDIILLDVSMPVLEGDRLANMLTRYHAEHPPVVLFFSSLDSQKLQNLVEQTGADGFVSKSEGDERLLEVLREWMAKREALL